MKNRTEKNWEELYSLQDEVLYYYSKEKGIFNNFVFSGGTALARFYLNHRYSEDLDFQSLEMSNDFFFVESKLYLQKLIEHFKDYQDEDFEPNFEEPNYHIVHLMKNDTLLKIENLNYFNVIDGKPHIMDNGLKVDNLKNILSNKITTFCNRQEAKDLFDILTISERYYFDWSDIIAYSSNKQLDEDEYNGTSENFYNSVKSFDSDKLIAYINSSFCKYHSNDFKDNEDLMNRIRILTINIYNKEPNELSKTGDLIEDAIPMDIFNNNDFKNIGD